MNAQIAIDRAVKRIGGRLAAWSGVGLERVTIDGSVLSRRPCTVEIKRRERTSLNGSCRLFATGDRWIAINLPRPEDVDMVPALLGHGYRGDHWEALESHCRESDADAILAQAHLLGLAVSALGEARWTQAPADPEDHRPDPAEFDSRPARRPRVFDLSVLWAGPLCGSLFARAGCDVVKVESASRPDRADARDGAHFHELNCGKRLWRVDFGCPSDRAELTAALDSADVIISSARRRGLDSLGLSPESVCARNPQAIWIAITGYGFHGNAAHRIGFGDDCAIAGGLAAFDGSQAPQFVHDAVADPLTGVRAAALGFRALALGRGGIVDVSLAATAAMVKAWSGVPDE